MEWVQIYDPLGQAWLSTLFAALPIVLLLATLGILEWPAHRAALTGLISALAVSVFVYGMPARTATATAIFGAAYGLLPIGWIVVNAIFLYDITLKTGTFEIIKGSVARLSDDRRIQALLIAFSFGAFIEGASGFGTPVAISAALLMGLGFSPLYSAGLALIANTAPVAYGAIGTPILTLASVTGLDAFTLGAMAGRQLPFVSLIVPAWLVATMSGWRGLMGVWPAVLVCGGSFAIVQFLWSNYVGPELVDIVGGIVSLAAVAGFCTVWKPRDVWRFPSEAERANPRGTALAGSAAASAPRASGRVETRHSTAVVVRAWVPWMILSVFVMLWGLPQVKALLNAGPAGYASYQATGRNPTPSPILSPQIQVPGLHRMVYRDFPVEPEPADRARLSDPKYRAVRAEAAVFSINWLSATGTGILFASLVSAAFLRVRPRDLLSIAGSTAYRMRWPLTTIAIMLSLGYVTRYGGTDATLGLAFTKTGWVYPFFAAMLGWLGVALTGSDTSSNVLFGSLQKITAQQLGLSPILITTANSTGGVMGKMIDAQSIVVATAATGSQGEEGRILRFVFWHSLALAAIMGLIVIAQAYWFTWMIPE
jgi:lactate permease